MNKLYTIYWGRGKSRKNFKPCFSAFNREQAIYYLYNAQEGLWKGEYLVCYEMQNGDSRKLYDSRSDVVERRFGRYEIQPAR